MDINNLAETLKKLTPEQRKLMKARLLGYTAGLPPSIDEFIESDFFMGRSWKNMLYPYWRQILRDIYPDEITTSNTMIVESLALGTGKTTVSVVMGAYQLCRALYLQDFSRCGINDLDKPLVILFNHTSSDKAEQECVGPLRRAMSRSIFWSQKKYPFPKNFEIKADSLRSNNAVGTNLIFASFSEVNFINNSKKMKERMDTVINRYTNRFMNFNGYLGGIIIDSSPKGAGSLVESLLQKYTFDIKIIRDTVWNVKGHIGGYSKETFDVYAGDDTHSPFIIDENHQLHVGYDPDRVVHVPLNLKPNFVSDILTALRDLAGFSVSATGSYISNKELVRKAFHLHYDYPKELRVKYKDYDGVDSIIDYYRNIIEYVLPRDRRIFIHVDLGIKGDYTGLSAGYYDGDYIDNDQDLNIKKIKIKVPFSIRIARKKGEETSIPKITEFLIWLNTMYEIYVSMDTYQSTNLHQNLDLNKIKNCYLSVDRTTAPYNFLKQEIYEGLIEGPDDEYLQKEITHLREVRNKIDHPSGYHKDQADSVAGVAWNISQNLKWAAKLPKAYQLLMAQKALNDTYGQSNVVTNLQNKITSLMDWNDDDDDFE